MLRHVSKRARQFLFFDFLTPSLTQPSIRFYSTKQIKQNTASLTSQSPNASFSPTVSGLDVHEAKVSSSNVPISKIQDFNHNLASIRLCLRRDLKHDENEGLLKLWTKLYKLKVVHMLGHSQLESLSKLMIQSFLRPEKTRKEFKSKSMGESEVPRAVKTSGGGIMSFSPGLREMLHDIALVTARNDSWDAMDALMGYYIRQQDPQAILNLYARFMDLVGDKDFKSDTVFKEDGISEGEVQKGANGLGERKEETGQLSVTAVEHEYRHIPIPAGRVHLLVAVIGAHAMKNDFQGALDTCMKTFVRLDEAQAKSFIQETFKCDSALRNLVQRYVKKILLAELVSRPVEFRRRVTRLGASRSTSLLQALYHSLIQGLSDENTFLVADPSLITDTKKIAVTHEIWTAFLSAFLKCEQKEWAGKVWDDMSRFGVPPGISMWTALFDAYGSIGATSDAVAAWELMIGQGIQPDWLACRAIVSVLFKARRPEHAMQMFARFREHPPETLDESHRVRQLGLFNTVLHGLCTTDQADVAENLRKEMERDGPKPDMVTYNTFIKYYGLRQQFRRVAATLKDLQEAGLEGDSYTYTTILSALLKAGKKDAAELVLSLVDKQRVKKSAALYSSLIDYQLREGREENLRAAMQMLAKMEEDPENPPNDVTYTSVLLNIYRMGWLETEDLIQVERDILKRIKDRGIWLTLPAYHSLIKACLVYPREHGVDQAVAYFEEMKSREIAIVQTTWYILLAGLLHRERWDIARRMVEEMYSSGFSPNGTLQRLVQKVRLGPYFGG